MRKRYLIAAAMLAAPAAEAQIVGGCRGETLAEVADCVARTSPAPAPQAQVGPTRLQPTRPANLGGAVQPTDLRAAPPRAAPPVTGAPVASMEVGDRLPPEMGVPLAPDAYGLRRFDAAEYYEVDGRIVRVDPDTRRVIEVSPLGADAPGLRAVPAE